MTELKYVEAMGAQLTVVAAVTEKGIVRGISHFSPVSAVRAEVEKAVGVLTEVVEWSTAKYRIPSYLRVLGDVSAWDVPGGVYLFRWAARTTDWRDPERRYSLEIPELLWRPSGWAGGRKGPE